jgi:uncharacterized protein YbaP (TraB family)
MKLVISISFGLWSFLGCAQNEYLVRKPYLYEITRNDNSKKSYLFGSVHMGVIPEDLPRTIWPYLDRADIVTTEINSDSSEEYYQGRQEFYWRKDSEPSIKEFLTDEEFKLISHWVEHKNGLNLKGEQLQNFLNKVSLFGLNYFLQTNIKIKAKIKIGESIRINKVISLDQQMLNKAIDKGKITDSLDVIGTKEFLKCDVGTHSAHLKDIRKYLHTRVEIDVLEKQRALLKAYRSGDSNSILAEIQNPDAFDEFENTCLLDNRNKNWMFKIESILENYESPFFIVGLAHIISGPFSLTELLSKKGYKLRRMSELDLPEEK